ncbi:glycosyltransferase [Pendulispora albinea]|uniref:Glycosyltransferase n=1 Tax=Pendulispora albinea TaxID=2741071 RepID=A0ABZ2LV40_9BACT
MKLVVFGLTISSSWGNGHATLWRGLCRALAQASHEVTFFECDVPYYAMHRDRPDPVGCTLHLYEKWEDVLPKVRATLANADAAIVTSYCPHARAATESVLSARVPMRVFYDLDTPVTLEHFLRGETVRYLPTGLLGDFDLVLSFTGGAALDALRYELGAQVVAPLYGSVDPETHHPCPPSRAYRSDLSYLGTYAEDRQAAVDRLFLDVARKLPSHSFFLAGSLYPEDIAWPRNVRTLAHLPPGDHATFFASSKLTLNATRGAMAKWGYCPSGRLFEAAACGVPILSDAWEGLDQFFVPGSEILLANDTPDAVRAIHTDPGHLARIAARARERTLDEHSAAVRARELVRLLEFPPESQATPRRSPLSGPEVRTPSSLPSTPSASGGAASMMRS